MAVPIEAPRFDVKLTRYNLAVLAYFLLLMTTQYALAYKYLLFIPEKWRGVATMSTFVFFGFQALFMVAVIPLGMAFIYSWLYLIDIRASVKSLYPIVVTSLTPFYILLGVMIVYGVFFLQVNLQPTEDVQRLSEMIRADVERQVRSGAFPLSRLGPVAALLSILLCAYLLYKRLDLRPLVARQLSQWPSWLGAIDRRANLGAIIAALIPLTFAGSLFIFQKLSGLLATNVMDKLLHPPR